MADRVSQVPAEVVVEPDDAQARVSQVSAEVVVESGDAKARVSQSAVEVIVASADAKARASQVPIEIVTAPVWNERQAYWDEVRLDGPDAMWRLDEASGDFLDSSYNGNDYSGNGNDFTPFGTVSYGQSGPVAPWPAISVGEGGGGTQTSFSTAVDNFTFEAWFMPTSVGADNQNIFSNVNGGNGWALTINQDGKLQVVVNGTTFLAESQQALTNGTWYHIVVTRRSGVWRYYINGELDTPNAGTTAPGAAVTTMTLLGGADLEASMAGAAYFERSLTGFEIRSHYNTVFESVVIELEAKWKAGFLTVPSGAGEVSVTLGHRPAAVIFYGANWTTEDSVIATTGTALFRGMVAPNFDNPTTVVQNAAAFSPPGDQHIIDNYAILNMTTAGTASVLYRATVELTDTGFTADFDTAAAGGYKIVYIALFNVNNALGMVGTYDQTEEFMFKADASLIHGAMQGPVASSGSWTSTFFGGAGYPGTNDLGWNGHAAGMTVACFPTSQEQQNLNELWNDNPDIIITSSSHFTGPFQVTSNDTALPTGEGLLDFAMSGDSFGGGMAVAWDDEVSDAGFTTPPTDVDDEVVVAVDGELFGALPFAPGLVISYSISDEPDGSDTGAGRTAGGFGVATRHFQWAAVIDGFGRGSYQSFNIGFLDRVTATDVHAGTLELTDTGFTMTTTEAGVTPGSWLWHAFGFPPMMWQPQIYRRVR